MIKTYAVKSVFGPTLQGEGSLAGAVTMFVRFAGCNVWDGREESRAASACPYCDTDFVGGVRVTAGHIVDELRALGAVPGMLVTLSGGEPLLQIDAALVRMLREAGFRIAIETNGTRALPLEVALHVEHVTMSPKVPRHLVALAACDDIKVLVPHPDERITPEAFDAFPARHRWVQPVNERDGLHGPNIESAVAACYAMAKRGRDWRLSLQVHKVIGVE